MASTATLPLLSTHAAAAAWLHGQGARALSSDHRALRAGEAFLAWPGRRHDARLHVPQALATGAAACLVEADALGSALDEAALAPAVRARVAAYEGLKREAGLVADAFLDAPSAAMEVVAVTGTNGKTSTTWWLAQALRHLGRRAAVVGTLGRGEPGSTSWRDGGLTTPDAVALQSIFADLRGAGVRACAIEASSIGLAEQRLAGTRLAVAAFTNLTRDHLDYHGSMQAYGAAKRSLFDTPGLRAAVVHVDDAFGAAMIPELPTMALWTVSSRGTPGARLTAADVVDAAGGGLAFTLREGRPRGTVDAADDLPAAQARVATPIVGRFNVDNLLVVAGCLRALGHPLAAVAAALGRLTPVPGRMQRVEVGVQFGGPLPEVVVDYAHTPDALTQALAALAPRAAARGGALWCVFGCGGERDASKRAPMGAAAVAGARHVVVTSDNPRGEAPQDIIAQVLAGTANAPGGTEVSAIEDRRAAIRHAIARARPRDLILVAGKGHERVQEEGGHRLPFSDVAEAAAGLVARAGAAPTSGARAASPETRP